jgi:DNA processing protein
MMSLLLSLVMSEPTLHNPDRHARPLAQTALGLLALQTLPGVGPAKALRAALLRSNFEALMTDHAPRWEDALETAHGELTDAARHGVTALSLFDDLYPARLRAIHDPPPVLFVQGSIDVLRRDKLVAIVGTREPTAFGCTATEELTKTLAAESWAVVSGLAKGVDTLAHGAALKYGTETVAILAGGLDRIYPAENKELAAAIVDRGGALVAEQRWGARPQRSAFVQRNRIQTALSVAVVITQTGLIGGTMHTARHAAAQGRPVFCPVPYAQHDKSEGLRVLLQEPARRLCVLLPAWRGAGSLCDRLGDEPLALPVSRDELHEFFDALELALDSDPQTDPQARWWPQLDPPSRLGKRDEVAADDDQAPLFAFVE